MPGSLASGTKLVNNGVIQSDISTGTILIDPVGAFTNNGTLAALNGGTTTLTLGPGAFTNLSGGTLSGGIWQVHANSTLRMPALAASRPMPRTSCLMALAPISTPVAAAH